jgi:Mlc titration factor MtfA (ptsG expression regulator)
MIWQKLKSLFSGPAEAVFEDGWVALLEANVPLYSRLPEEQRLRLHRQIALFVASTRFEGCGELDLTEEMVLTVAAQACLLVLNREGEPYPKLRSVLLYPTTFSSVQKRSNAFGVVTEMEVHRLGESWTTGTVVLAWDSVVHGARNVFDGQNVTFHEFAHQLDHEDGDTDGAPGLESREAYRSWARVFTTNYEELVMRVEEGKKTLMDSYGATEPAEFFAVATETFFEKPVQLQKKRPELYAELKAFYGVDPCEWFRKG